MFHVQQLWKENMEVIITRCLFSITMECFIQAHSCDHLNRHKRSISSVKTSGKDQLSITMHDLLTSYICSSCLFKNIYIYAMLLTFKGVVWSLENMPSLFFIFHNFCIENSTKVKKKHKDLPQGQYLQKKQEGIIQCFDLLSLTGQWFTFKEKQASIQ